VGYKKLRAGNLQAFFDAFQSFGELIQTHLLLHDLVIVVCCISTDSGHTCFQAGYPVLDLAQFVFDAVLTTAHSA